MKHLYQKRKCITKSNKSVTGKYHTVFIVFWNFQRQRGGGGNGKFSEAGEEFFRGDQFFLDQAGGKLKIATKNNFETDIDSKVMSEISFFEYFTLFKAISK